MDTLSEEQRNVLIMVIYRLMAAVAPVAVHKATKALFDIAGYEFKAEGKEIISSGFKAVIVAKYRALGKVASETENILLPLSEGDNRQVQALDMSERETTPPARYTENTLLGMMETCGKGIDDEDLKAALKGKGVGTPATRADIIEKLINKYKYVERQGTKLISTQAGRDVIAVTDPELALPDLTAKWESQLTDMAEGKLPFELFACNVSDFLSDFIATHKDAAPVKDISQSSGEKEVLGKCPKCGRDVVENKAGYGCTGGKDVCNFIIWKTAGSQEHPKTVTPAQAKKILANGRSDLIKGFVGKSGKTFDAYLRLKDDKSGVEFDFGDKISEDTPAFGKCPLCGGDVYAKPKGWSCSADGCNFIIWKTVGSKDHPKVLSDAQAKKLLTAKKTDLIKGFIGKSGKPFDAFLVLQPDGKVGFEFPPRNR
jgi:Topoisomerase IA